jgi:hypothetical protein
MAVVLVGLALAGCGTSSPTGFSGKDIQPIAANLLPDRILDLEVHQEDVKNTVAQTRNSYVKAVSIFSMRRSNLVQATLQVSQLSNAFNIKSGRQKAALADKIGGSRAQPFRLGGDTVYLTQGIRQKISIWFRGRYLMVLSSREDFDQPRSLLRAALEIKP